MPRLTFGFYTGPQPPSKPKECYENATITTEDLTLTGETPENVKKAEAKGVIWHCDGSKPMECPKGPHAERGVWHFKPKKHAGDLP